MIARPMIQMGALQHHADAARETFDDWLTGLALLVAPATGSLVPPLARQCHQHQFPVRPAAELTPVAGSLQDASAGPLPFRTTV